MFKIRDKVSYDYTSNEVKTIIGREDFFKGEINSNNFLRIDGDFLGSITSTKRVIIGSQGRVKSNINTEELVVSGIVVGNITAKKKVKIFSSACVLGNIISKSIEVEEGAIIDGYINIGKPLVAYDDISLHSTSYYADESLLEELEIKVNENSSFEDEANKIFKDSNIIINKE